MDNKKEESYELPPLNCDSENKPSDEVVIESDPVNPVEPLPYKTDIQKAEALYWEKYVEYSTAYGQPLLVNAGSSSKYTYAGGVSFAQLLDFDGNGIDELVIASYDESHDPEASIPSGNKGLNPYGYTLEVWGYQTQSEDIACLFSQSNLTHGDGRESTSFALGQYEGKPCMIDWMYDKSMNALQGSVTLLTLSDGSFTAAKTYAASLAQSTYAIDGAAADEAAYQASTGAWFPDAISYALSGGDDNGGTAASANQGFSQWGITSGDLAGASVKDAVSLSEETREALRASVKESGLAQDPDDLTPETPAQSVPEEVVGGEPAPAATVIEDEYYSVTLPDAWTGNVDVVAKGNGATAVNLAGTDVPLVTFKLADSAVPLLGGGDPGYGSIWNTDGTKGKRLDAWISAYAWCELEGATRKDTWGTLTDAQKSEVLALTSGGEITLDTIHNYSSSECLALLQSYYAEAIFSTALVY